MDRIARHNAVRDVFHAAAQSAALAPSKETPGLVPGSQSRPGDFFIPCWSLGRPTAFDVLVISPLQDLTIAEAALSPGHALHVGVQRKLPLTSQPAAPLVWTLCLWWPRPLAGLLRIPSTLSSASAGPFTTEVGPPTLPQPPVICSAAWQWLCGGATLPSGYTDSPPFLPSWTALSDSLIPLFC